MISAQMKRETCIFRQVAGTECICQRKLSCAMILMAEIKKWSDSGITVLSGFISIKYMVCRLRMEGCSMRS